MVELSFELWRYLEGCVRVVQGGVEKKWRLGSSHAGVVFNGLDGVLGESIHVVGVLCAGMVEVGTHTVCRIATS